MFGVTYSFQIMNKPRKRLVTAPFWASWNLTRDLSLFGVLRRDCASRSPSTIVPINGNWAGSEHEPPSLPVTRGGDSLKEQDRIFLVLAHR